MIIKYTICATSAKKRNVLHQQIYVNVLLGKSISLISVISYHHRQTISQNNLHISIKNSHKNFENIHNNYICTTTKIYNVVNIQVQVVHVYKVNIHICFFFHLLPPTPVYKPSNFNPNTDILQTATPLFKLKLATRANRCKNLSNLNFSPQCIPKAF